MRIANVSCLVDDQVIDCSDGIDPIKGIGWCGLRICMVMHPSDARPAVQLPGLSRDPSVWRHTVGFHERLSTMKSAGMCLSI
jgi:hypothetical protein